MEYVGPSIKSQGFHLETCGVSGFCGRENLAVYSRNHVFQADKGGAAVILWNARSFLLTKESRAPFDFYSIDLAPAQSGFGFSADITFNFLDGSSETQDVVVSGLSVQLKTFIFDKTDLVSVLLNGTYQHGQFDNLVLDERKKEISTVAEPAGFLLLAAGLMSWCFSYGSTRATGAALST